MKSPTLALLAWVTITVMVCAIQPSRAVSGGQFVVYNYMAKSLGGVPGTSDNSTGIKMDMTVSISFSSEKRVRATLKIERCWIEAFIGTPPQDISAFQFQESTCQELMAQCLSFDLDNGRITAIYPSIGEPVRILNIKRGILSVFQGTPNRPDGTFIEEQTDVLGTCHVHGIKSSNPGEVYILQKRDTEACPNRAKVFSTIFPASKHQEAKFVFGDTTSHMTFKYDSDSQDLVLEKSAVTETQSFAPVSKGTGSATVIMSQVLSRVKGTPYDDICQSSPASTLRSSLVYDFQEATCSQQSNGPCQPGPIITSMASLENPDEVAQQFGKLIEEMRTCNKDRLKQLKGEYVYCQIPDNPKLRKMHTYYLDALAWLGTEPALNFISDLVRDSCLSESRRRELTVSLSMIPLHRLCSPCKLIDVALDIAKNSEDSMTSILVLGAVVRHVSKYPQSTCIIKEPIDWLLKLHSKSSTGDKQKIYVLKALGNIGSMQGLPVITETLLTTRGTTSEMNFERRLAAIHAMHRMAHVDPYEIRSMALLLYNDRSEQVEARIAAFLAYFKSPFSIITSLEFRKLVDSLRDEPNPYVKSFVYTFLSGIEQSDNPRTAQYKEAIVYVMRATNAHYWCKGCDLGYFSSKATNNYISLADANLPRCIPPDTMGLGMSTEFAYTDASTLPRSGAVKLTVNAFGYTFDALEVGVRGQGTSRLLEKLFGPTGYLRLGTRTLEPSGMPGPQPTMCSLEEEPMWFSGYVKAFGDELAWNQVDEDDINNILYSSNPEFSTLREVITQSIMSEFDFSDWRRTYNALGNYLKYILTGKFEITNRQISVSKSASILDVKRTIPTVLGLPLSLSALATVSTSLSGTGTMMVNGDSLVAEGNIQPQAAVCAMVSFVLDAGRMQPSLVHTGTVKTSFKQSAKLTIDDNYRMRLAIEDMPSKPESVVFEAKYNQYVYVNGHSMEMGISKREEVELYETFGESVSDLEVLTPISYPNSTGVPGAPFFPLSGPAEAKLILRPTSSNPSPIYITVWNSTQLSTTEGTIRGSANEGSKKAINAVSNWFTFGKKPVQIRIVNLTVASVPGTFRALFQGNTSRRMDIEGWMNLDTAISHTTSHVKFNRSHFYGSATRIRIAPDNQDAIIMIPEFMCELTGSLVNNTQGELSATLYLEDSDKPQWLRANFTTVGLMVNITGESSQFTETNVGYILPYPLKSPVCTYSSHFVVTFDGLYYPLNTATCEYVLVRHRNESDNFAVSVSNGGKQVNVYINETKYTMQNGQLEVNGITTQLPYKIKHEIQIREVTIGTNKFMRLSAWVGLDIYYNGFGVHLSINGFYRRQTAGLCGNANDDSSRDDEMVTPACEVAKTTEDFIRSWAMQPNCFSSVERPPNPPRIGSEAVCGPLFSDLHHHDIDCTPYLNACLQTVKVGHSPEESLRAYIMAAASRQVAITVGCSYGQWSSWSGCSWGQVSYRTRSVEINLQQVGCHKTSERRQCDSSMPCESYRDYITVSVGTTSCKSTHKYIQCKGRCKAVLSNDLMSFHCEGKQDPVELPFQIPLYCIQE